jgi:hypothetical protein
VCVENCVVSLLLYIDDDVCDSITVREKCGTRNNSNLCPPID